MSRGTVIVGATSAIARGVARACAGRGDRLVLAGRDHDECQRIAADLHTRHAVEAHAERVDLASFDPEPFVDRCAAHLDNAIDGLVCCQGFMAEQAEAQNNPELVARTNLVNLTSVVQLCEAFAPRMRTPGAQIGVVSSVAGDRGRPSNHIYGASKAGVNAYLEGLGPRLRERGIAVTCVRPGFVDTAMTWGLPGMFLVADPDDVGASIVRGMAKGAPVVYTPFFWRFIMLVIRNIPGPIYRRLSL
ncbi:MAG: SDR family NAD(P)-dependent oxidoreductase [Planctomycetota bacterium]